MRGGKRGACGRAVHGIPSPDGSANLCNACRRPGSSDHLNTGWQHIGAGEYWELLTEWATAAAGAWPHHRDLIEEPLQPKECICSRQDCERIVPCVCAQAPWIRRKRGGDANRAKVPWRAVPVTYTSGDSRQGCISSFRDGRILDHSPFSCLWVKQIMV